MQPKEKKENKKRNSKKSGRLMVFYRILRNDLATIVVMIWMITILISKVFLKFLFRYHFIIIY